MARILVTGASGLVGSRLVVRLRERHDVHGTYWAHHPDFLRHAPDRLRRLDVANGPGLRTALDAVAPEVVVHCAAKTDVDGCESARDEARRANVVPVEEIVRWARPRGARLVLMSTDFVFNGKEGPYAEDAHRDPLCVYSHTKAQAEEVAESLEGALIARAAVIFGVDFGHLKRNFAAWLIGELEAGRPVRIVTDQWTTPTISEQIAEFIARAVERDVAGVIHASGAECVSRFDFARAIAARFGLDGALITPIATATLRQVAKRPERGGLATERTEARLGLQAWPIAKALDLMDRQLKSPDRAILAPWW